jgi:ribosomal protein S10
MDSYTDKKGDKGEFNDVDAPIIRIILKSQETKNLDFVANKII